VDSQEQERSSVAVVVMVVVVVPEVKVAGADFAVLVAKEAEAVAFLVDHPENGLVKAEELSMQEDEAVGVA